MIVVDFELFRQYPRHDRPGKRGDLRAKVATADYVGVEEVVLTSADGLLRTYTATDVDVRRGLGVSGEVLLTNERDRLAGQFSFPDGPISGRFRAEPCEPDADLFAVIALSPLLVCP